MCREKALDKFENRVDEGIEDSETKTSRYENSDTRANEDQKPRETRRESRVYKDEIELNKGSEIERPRGESTERFGRLFDVVV